MASSIVPIERRREVFAAIVAAQDAGQTVAESHESVAEAFGVTKAQVKAIEKEGLAAEWPRWQAVLARHGAASGRFPPRHLALQCDQTPG